MVYTYKYAPFAFTCKCVLACKCAVHYRKLSTCQQNSNCTKQGSHLNVELLQCMSIQRASNGAMCQTGTLNTWGLLPGAA